MTEEKDWKQEKPWMTKLKDEAGKICEKMEKEGQESDSEDWNNILLNLADEHHKEEREEYLRMNDQLSEAWEETTKLKAEHEKERRHLIAYKEGLLLTGSEKEIIKLAKDDKIKAIEQERQAIHRKIEEWERALPNARPMSFRKFFAEYLKEEARHD